MLRWPPERRSRRIEPCERLWDINELVRNVGGKILRPLVQRWSDRAVAEEDRRRAAMARAAE